MKIVNVVTWTFCRFVGYVSLEISRCCSKSILMKVTDVVIYNEDYAMRFKKNSVELF